MSGARLGAARVIAFVATTDAARCRAFYTGVLGLRVVQDDRFALVLDANGIELRVQKVESLEPQPFTVLGWRVADIRSTMASLSALGVRFERYPYLEQDGAGVWQAPGGARVAWFKDPDGNLLSVTEMGAGAR